MTDNTSAFQKMLFSTVAAVTSKPFSPIGKMTKQILVVETFDSRYSNQRRQARGAVSNETIYKGVSKSLIHALPELLPADPLTKEVT